MQPADRHCVWRSDFLAALRLLAQAAARQPYGVADPVLCGSAAVALYTGDLWPACGIEVRSTDPQALNTELMSLGCRFAERSSRLNYGLWHPDCRLAISVLEDRQGLPPADRLNVLTVTLDIAGGSHSAVTAPKLRVMGVEDLIAAQTISWLAHEPQCEDVAALIRALVTLGRLGVGGRFRAAYLQRRLACETLGAVVLDPACGTCDTREARATTLAAMQTVIEAWYAQSGLWFPRAGLFATNPSSGREEVMLDRNDRAGREGQGDPQSSNVVLFGPMPGSPSRPR
jgi:hypothetical protein